MSYVDFFLNSAADVIELELFEISHPDMSAVYRYVRNARAGVTVTLPGEGATAFVYRPAVIRRSRTAANIHQAVSIDIGDPGDVLAGEADLIDAADGFDTKPILRYWSYRSDDLTTPLTGPLVFEVTRVSTKGARATIDAQAPERNQSSTGDLYTFSRFEPLRGEL